MLCHERWGIETVYAEMKSTLLRRRVLRAGDVDGIDREIWAFLLLYQVIRTAMAQAAALDDGLSELQMSFTFAIEAGKDQIVRAEGIMADEELPVDTLIARELLARPLPPGQLRTAQE
ncbi:hypothetical protein [Salininema proteolyticum]|uniref:Transposase DDE domain-containing protein n=1 Tax=Salininema proteolyticum TaxID=1607685 RepID=A0ABV8U4T7_9ACTN